MLRIDNDTGAVDRVVREGNHITGTAVAGRTMRVDYRLELESTGEVRSYAFLLGPPPATVGDSVTFAPAAAGTSGTVVSRGRMPLWNASPGLYDVLLRRARIAAETQQSRSGADATVALPLFVLARPV